MKVEISTLNVVQPGDALVVTLRPGVSPVTADAFKRELAKRLPDIEVVVLAGVDVTTVKPVVEPAAKRHRVVR